METVDWATAMPRVSQTPGENRAAHQSQVRRSAGLALLWTPMERHCECRGTRHVRRQAAAAFRNKPQRFRIVLRPSSFTGEKLNGSLTGPFATIHPTAHPTEWFAVAQWPQISAGES